MFQLVIQNTFFFLNFLSSPRLHVTVFWSFKKLELKSSIAQLPSFVVIIYLSCHLKEFKLNHDASKKEAQVEVGQVT